MTPTLRRKLEALAERREELERLLSDPDVLGDNERFRNFSREFSQLEPVAVAMAEGAAPRPTSPLPRPCARTRNCARWPKKKPPPRRRELAALEAQLALLLVPRDPRDEGNLFLEVRAGTGGDEAAIFAGDLFRM